MHSRVRIPCGSPEPIHLLYLLGSKNFFISMEYLQDLNPQQKKAVLEEHKLICIIAGPGCGKTKTLIGRIIYLLAEKKIEPRQILVLTFAKKAIKEIKKRI